MKAIIMAAGKGTRISRDIGGKPKCTLDLNGKTLIETTVNLLKKKGINKIYIITGYKHKEIENNFDKELISFYYNPFFEVTNSLASLWFARDIINDDEDIIFLNGDVFCEEKVLDRIIKTKKSPVLFADTTRIEDADYRFNFSDGILKKFGKELSNQETTGEYIGYAKIKANDIEFFKKRMFECIENGNYNKWWEDILYSMVEERKIYVDDLKGLFWAEIDYIEDYERIIEYVGRKKREK